MLILFFDFLRGSLVGVALERYFTLAAAVVHTCRGRFGEILHTCCCCCCTLLLPFTLVVAAAVVHTYRGRFGEILHTCCCCCCRSYLSSSFLHPFSPTFIFLSLPFQRQLLFRFPPPPLFLPPPFQQNSHSTWWTNCRSTSVRTSPDQHGTSNRLTRCRTTTDTSCKVCSLPRQ